MGANNDSGCIETHSQLGLIEKISFAITFDSGDGSFADYELTSKIDGILLQPQMNPGDYDITLIDENGLDVLKTDSTGSADQILTLKIAGNSNIGATTRIDLICFPLNEMTKE